MKSPAKPWEIQRAQSTPAVVSATPSVASAVAGPAVPPRTYAGGVGASPYGGYGASGYGSPYSGSYGSSGYGSPYSSYGGGGGYGSSMYGGRRSMYGGRGGMYGGRSMYGRMGGMGSYGGMYGNSYGANPALPDDSSWMGSIQRTLQGFGQFSELLDGSYFSMHESFSSLMEFLNVVGELRHHAMWIVKALAGLMLLQVTGRSVKEYLGWRSSSDLDPDLASFRHFSGAKKPASSVWPKVVLVAGLMAVFGPFLWRRLFGANRSSAKKIPPRRVVAVYDYKAESAEELPLRTGDLIVVEDERSNPEWWRGRDQHDNVGYFPSSFVETLVLEEEEEFEDEEDEEELDEETKLLRRKCKEVVRERRRRDREAASAVQQQQQQTPMAAGRGPASSPMYAGQPRMYGEEDMQRRLSYNTPVY